MGGNELRDDRQADSRSLERPGLWRGASVERLENTLTVARVHAGAGICEVDHDSGRQAPGADGNRTALGREFQGVGQQVVQHQADLGLVGVQDQVLDFQLRLDAVGRDGEALRAEGAGDDRAQGEVGQLESRHLRLPGAVGQQVLDQLLQPQGVLAHDVGDFALLRIDLAHGAVQQQFGALADVRQRRLQLVRHVPQEAVLLLGQLQQPDAQPLQLPAERLDVRGAGDRDRAGERAPAEFR